MPNFSDNSPRPEQDTDTPQNDSAAAQSSDGSSESSAPRVTGSGTVVLPPGSSASESSPDSSAVDTPEPGQNAVFARTMEVHTPEEHGVDEIDVQVADVGLRTAVVPADEAKSADNPLQAAGDSAVSQPAESASTGASERDSGPGDNPESSYELLSRIGEGGMGAIYLARQTALNREVAIKTLKPLTAEEREARGSAEKAEEAEERRRQMFLSEALVTANLVHPHIVPIHDLSQDDPASPFYVMKRINGTPWHERLREMSLPDNLEVLLKVCDAVAYAHHRGVVNRDLKPENVMLGEFGEVLVLDWGLATPAGNTHQIRFQSLTASYGAGTPAYMAPELWNGPADRIGPWSDIYLLGATLFEIITGKPPHQFPDPPHGTSGTALWSIIDRVVRVNRIRETEARGELFDIAMKAMSTDPGDRYGSVVEFQHAIREYQRHQESLHLSQRADQLLLADRRQQSPTAEAAVNDSGEQSSWTGPERRSGRDRRESYREYQAATTLYEEAYNAWPDNTAARDGLRTARLEYAALAHAKGDYDLGLQIAALEQGPEFDALRSKLRRSRVVRQGIRSVAMVAVAAIILLGIFSTTQAIRISRQNDAIVALHGTRESLQSQNETLQQEMSTALEESSKAAARAAAAVAQQQAAQADLAAAVQQRERVESELGKAEAALKTAQTDRMAALAAQQAAELETRRAQQQTEVAAQLKVQAEERLQKVATELKKLDAEKARAEVELRNTQIGSLVRNADYATAVQRIEQLIAALNEDPAMQQLPAAEREQREVELRARLRQLRQRTLQTQSPVQTQLIDRPARRIIWGDAGGRLTVRGFSDDPGQLKEEILDSAKVDGPVERLAWGPDRKSVLVATGHDVLLWSPGQEQLQPVTTHSSPVKAIARWQTIVISADQTGDIRASVVNAAGPATEAWTIRGTASIRDLDVLARSGILLAAASRGDESADVVAWRLSHDPNQRPERLGQLRFPRHQIDPPLRLKASPDESVLVLSNTRNGGLWVLPRQTESPDAAGFPFQHAADLASEAWVSADGEQHLRPVNDLSFSADGQHLVTASDDRSVFVWHLEPGSAQKLPQLRLQQRLEGHGARVLSAGFLDADGRYITSTAADRFCRIWDVNQVREQRKKIERLFGLRTTEARTQPLPSAVSRSGNRTRPRYRLTAHRPVQSDSLDGIPLNTTGLQRGAVRSLAFSPDGRFVATGAGDGSTVIWDANTGEPVTQDGTATAELVYRDGHDYNISCLLFLPPFGRIAATTGYDGSLCLWDADPDNKYPGRELARVDGLGLVNSAAVSPDGQAIATTWAGPLGHGRDAAVWRVKDLLEAKTSRPHLFLRDYHREPVSAIAFSPDGRLICTAGRDGRVAVWEHQSGKLLASGQPHTTRTLVRQLVWLNNTSLLSAGLDGRLVQLTWSDGHRHHTPTDDDPAPLQVAVVYQHDDSPIERLALSPDRTRFVTVSSQRTQNLSGLAKKSRVQMWRVGQTSPLQQLQPARIEPASAREVRSAAWSQDGRQVLLVVDSTLQLIDTNTGKILRVLRSSHDNINFAAFVPGNHRHVRPGQNADLIGTFHQRTARLWKLSDAAHVATFQPPATVLALALSAEPTATLITGGRSLRLFDATRGSPNHGRSIGKVFQPHQTPVHLLQMSPVDSTFVSCGADGVARLWQTQAGPQKVTFRGQFDVGPGLPVHLEYAQDGQQLKWVTGSGQVNTYVPGGDHAEQQSRLPLSGVELQSADFHPQRSFLVVAGRDRESQESIAHVYQIDNHPATLHCVIRGHEAGGISGAAFLPHSDHLVTAGADGRVLIWNWQPDRDSAGGFNAYEAYEFLTARQPRAHAGSVTALAVGPTGRIATAGGDGSATVWNNPFLRGH